MISTSKTWYSQIEAAILDRLCRPEPPTPTSSMLPLGWLITRTTRVTANAIAENVGGNLPIGRTWHSCALTVFDGVPEEDQVHGHDTGRQVVVLQVGLHKLLKACHVQEVFKHSRLSQEIT